MEVNPNESLQWCHIDQDGVLNHRRLDLLKGLFWRKEDINALRHWPLCGESTDRFPSQKASNAKKYPFVDVIMIPDQKLWFLAIIIIYLYHNAYNMIFWKYINIWVSCIMLYLH